MVLSSIMSIGMWRVQVANERRRMRGLDMVVLVRWNVRVSVLRMLCVLDWMISVYVFRLGSISLSLRPLFRIRHLTLVSRPKINVFILSCVEIHVHLVRRNWNVLI